MSLQRCGVSIEGRVQGVEPGKSWTSLSRRPWEGGGKNRLGEESSTSRRGLMVCGRGSRGSEEKKGKERKVVGGGREGKGGKKGGRGRKEALPL